MFTKELPRIDTAKIADQLKAGRADLLSDASKHLGYRTPQSTTLLQKLIAVDIAPFKTLAVEEYKKGMAKTGMYSHTRNWLIFFFSSLTVGGSALYGAFHFHTWFFDPIVVLSGLTFVLTLFSVDEIGSGTRTVKLWASTTVGRYEGTIPDHVLQKGVEIKKAYPELSVGINYLESTNEVVARDPDPFLTVSDGGTTYYVEQWDERDFPTIEE